MPRFLKGCERSGKAAHFRADHRAAKLLLQGLAQTSNAQGFANRLHPAMVEAAIDQAVAGSVLAAAAHEAASPCLHDLMEHRIMGRGHSPLQLHLGRRIKRAG